MVIRPSSNQLNCLVWKYDIVWVFSLVFDVWASQKENGTALSVLWAFNYVKQILLLGTDVGISTENVELFDQHRTQHRTFCFCFYIEWIDYISLYLEWFYIKIWKLRASTIFNATKIYTEWSKTLLLFT